MRISCELQESILNQLVFKAALSSKTLRCEHCANSVTDFFRSLLQSVSLEKCEQVELCSPVNYHVT